MYETLDWWPHLLKMVKVLSAILYSQLPADDLAMNSTIILSATWVHRATKYGHAAILGDASI